MRGAEFLNLTLAPLELVISVMQVLQPAVGSPYGAQADTKMSAAHPASTHL